MVGVRCGWWVGDVDCSIRCGPLSPLWLWEEMAPRDGGGWGVGGRGRGIAPQQRRDWNTLTVYCSQARCPLPAYR